MKKFVDKKVVYKVVDKKVVYKVIDRKVVDKKSSNLIEILFVYCDKQSKHMT